jgi:hypothetical protein
MVDFTDPAIWSPIVQTIVLTLTLVIFIFSFRSQNRAMREQAYERVMDDYGDAMRMLLEKPELYPFQMELFNRSSALSSARPGREQRSYSREDLAVRNFVVMMYGFFERVHFLYRRKWINEDTWKQWAAFLAIVAAHPVFKDVHQSSVEMFDKEFVDYVSSIISDSSKEQQGSRNAK